MNKEVRNGLLAVSFALSAGFVGRITQDTECHGPTTFDTLKVGGRIAVCEESHGYSLYSEGGVRTRLRDLEDPDNVMGISNGIVRYDTFCTGEYVSVAIEEGTSKEVARYTSPLPYQVVVYECGKYDQTT